MMLHLKDEYIKENMLKGSFGLEKENLRVMPDGFLSHTPDPVPDDPHIVRDFSEGQMEINTLPYPNAEEAVSALRQHEKDLVGALEKLPSREYLWLFSNPPYIRGEEDIPIAVFKGEDAWKTEYRKHLSAVYGRYKMTFSGIHVNYSFDEDLLRREAELRGITGEKGFRDFKDSFYMSLTEKTAYCGWLLVVLTAASPVIDGSFIGWNFDDTVDTRMASLRCSERGYWNFFDPVFSYDSIESYADSIEKYVKSGDLMASSELYYPVRLKPNSAYSIDTLRKEGAGHIELRMFDLNPLCEDGVDIRDLKFAGYLLAYLAAGGRMGLSEEDQIHVAENFKHAAHYDIDSTEIIGKGGFSESTREAALSITESMRQFYEEVRPDDDEIKDVICFEESKLKDDRNRYAYRVLQEYGSDYVKKGLELAKARQGR